VAGENIKSIKKNVRGRNFFLSHNLLLLRIMLKIIAIPMDIAHGSRFSLSRYCGRKRTLERPS
jgi:hypothetical protein